MMRPTGFVSVCCCFFEMLSMLIFWSNVLLLGICCLFERHTWLIRMMPTDFVCVCCCFFKMLSVDVLIKCVASWNMLPFSEAHPKNDDDAYRFCVCMFVCVCMTVWVCWCVISQCCLLKDHVDFLIKCVVSWNMLPFWEAHPKNDDDAYRFCVCICMSVCAAALATPLPTFSFQWSTVAWCCMYNSA